MLRTIIRTPILCFLSAGLLILSHPPFDLWFFAWVALVPMMMACDFASRSSRVVSEGRAFGVGYLTGLFFFSGTVYWFIHVTLPGAIVAILYLSCYFGVFTLCLCLFRRKRSEVRLFLLPSIWVILEFVRSRLITGFDWVSMGHSQYKVLPLIQIADVTGVFGVSFLVVMVNVFIGDRILKGDRAPFSLKKGTVPFLMIALTLCYGIFRLNFHSPVDGEPSSGETLKIAVIQGNVPQEKKWQPSEWPGILETYQGLTLKAVERKPDLIIWPETSLPGYYLDMSPLVDEEDVVYFKRLQEFVSQIKIPLLFGTVTKVDEAYRNSAILLSPEGEIIELHHKLHLVPFGEFLPWRDLFPFLAEIVPIEDFTPGERVTVFPQEFSVLICFEDTVARVTRSFVQNGAKFLVNITNDAWFLESSAPSLHLQSAVFRTVENRRALVRAGNTGVSGFINKFGKIESILKESSVFVPGYLVGNVVLNTAETFYTKFGDIFAILCMGCILWGIIKK